MKKKLKQLLSIAVIASTSIVNAQTWSFANEPANNSVNFLNYTRPSDLSGPGSKYVVGSFGGTVTFSSTTITSSGGQDGFVSRILTGSTIWVVGVGGTSNEEIRKVVNTGGDVYVAGTRSGNNSVSFKNANGSSPLILPSGGGNCFVAKYTLNGVAVWATAFQGTIEDLAFHNTANKLFVTGNFDPAILRISTRCFDASSGGLLWTANSTNGIGATSTGKGVATDASGNCYVLSNINGVVTFGSPTPYTALTQDLLMTKFDASGNFVWGKQIGSTSGLVNEFAKDLDLDGSGNIYITGNYASGTTFMEGVSFPLTNSGGRDLFLAKYNNSGTALWANKIGGLGDDIPLGMDVDGSGDIALVVHNKPTNSVTLSASPCDVFTSQNNGYDNKWYVAIYSSLGAYSWAKAPLTDNASALPVGIALDGSSATNVQVIGVNNGSTDFDSFNIAGTNTNMFLARATKGTCAGKMASTVGITDQSNDDLSNSFKVYPNPNNGVFTISSIRDAATTIEIYDVLGRSILTTVLNGNSDYVGNLSTFTKGIYVLKLTTEEKTYSTKLIVE